MANIMATHTPEEMAAAMLMLKGKVEGVNTVNNQMVNKLFVVRKFLADKVKILDGLENVYAQTIMRLPDRYDAARQAYREVLEKIDKMYPGVALNQMDGGVNEVVMVPKDSIEPVDRKGAKEDAKGDVIFHNTVTYLGWRERVRILCGAPVCIDFEIHCKNEQVTIAKTETKVHVGKKRVWHKGNSVAYSHTPWGEMKFGVEKVEDKGGEG